MATTDPIPAVSYLRMSDRQQELSIEQQRPLVRELAAKNGYVLVREYAGDAGKSASKNREKRTDLDRLIKDAETLHDFKAILCYDTARFTREDSQLAADDKVRLRKAGVHILDTVADGTFDWNTSEGRLMDAFRAEGNNAAAVKISQQTTRGRGFILEQGWWAVGNVPYGFDRHYTDGTHSITVTRSDRSFKKGRNWHLKLVVNEAEAVIVREIFTRTFAEGISMRALAADLTQRGIPSPDPTKGKAVGWTKDTIKSILHQKAYIGIGHIGSGRRVNRETMNFVGKREKPGACPAIIDRHLWDSVHDAINRRKAEGRKPHFYQSATLSGFVVCGHCGYRMSKKLLRGRVNFTCESANKRPYLGCRQWRAFEDTLLPDALKWMAKELDFELLKALQAKPKELQTADEALLEGEIQKLTKKVTNATESALEAPRAAREAAWKIVNEWQGKLDEARTRLQAIQNARNDDGLKELAKWWDIQKKKLAKVEKVLGTLPSILQGGKTTPMALLEAAEKHQLRELMAKLGFEIKLWWRHEPEARKKDRSAFEYVLEEQQISVKVPLNSGNSVGDDSSMPLHRVFAFTKKRKVA